MASRKLLSGRYYRVWLVDCEPWTPATWRALPLVARAREALDEHLYSAAEARALIEGFNGAALGAGGRVWAIAARARLGVVEDLCAGALIDPGKLGRKRGPATGKRSAVRAASAEAAGSTTSPAPATL